jgi:hypothetical protein
MLRINTNYTVFLLGDEESNLRASRVACSTPILNVSEAEVPTVEAEGENLIWALALTLRSLR